MYSFIRNNKTFKSLITSFFALLMLVSGKGISIYQHDCKKEQLHVVSLAPIEHCNKVQKIDCCKERHTNSLAINKNCCTSVQHFYKTDISNFSSKEFSKTTASVENYILRCFIPEEYISQLQIDNSDDLNYANHPIPLNNKVFFRKLNVMRC